MTRCSQVFPPAPPPTGMSPAPADVAMGMPITRLNHAVLYVRDVDETVAFYRDVLGFEVVGQMEQVLRGAAFLRAAGSTNDHDLGVFAIGPNADYSAAGRTSVGLY